VSGCLSRIKVYRQTAHFRIIRYRPPHPSVVDCIEPEERGHGILRLEIRRAGDDMIVTAEPLDADRCQIAEHINFALIDDAHFSRRPYVTFEIQLVHDPDPVSAVGPRRAAGISIRSQLRSDGERSPTYDTNRQGHIHSPDIAYDASVDEGSHDSSAGEEEPCGSRRNPCTTRNIDSVSVDADVHRQPHKRRKVDHHHATHVTPLDTARIPSYVHEESDEVQRRSTDRDRVSPSFSNYSVGSKRARLLKQMELKRLELENLQSQCVPFSHVLGYNGLLL
jgi:hypothetical protein